MTQKLRISINAMLATTAIAGVVVVVYGHCCVRTILSWRESARAKSKGGVFGRGSQPLSHQLGVSGSAVSSPGGARSSAPAAQQFSCVFKCTGWRLLLHSGPRLWNSLPADVQSAPSLTTFRQKLKTHLYISAVIPRHCPLVASP